MVQLSRLMIVSQRTLTAKSGVQSVSTSANVKASGRHVDVTHLYESLCALRKGRLSLVHVVDEG